MSGFDEQRSPGNTGRIKIGGRGGLPEPAPVRRGPAFRAPLQANEEKILSNLQLVTLKLVGSRRRREKASFAAVAGRCAIWLLKLCVKPLNERHLFEIDRLNGSERGPWPRKNFRATSRTATLARLVRVDHGKKDVADGGDRQETWRKSGRGQLSRLTSPDQQRKTEGERHAASRGFDGAHEQK